MIKDLKWYADAASKQAYDNLKESVEPLVRSNFPGPKQEY